MTRDPATADRCRGVLLGLAAGDRNGGPTEFAVCLAESLAERRAFDRDDMLQAAVYFVTADASFDAALAASLAFAGPANYCPVLVGAIGGARWGASAIRAEHLAHCRDVARVEDAASMLAASWSAEAR